jgi:hypothetical protein
MELPPDLDEFFDSLIAHEVEFLVVGAYALAYHGAPRFTGDIDVRDRPLEGPCGHRGARRRGGVTRREVEIIGLDLSSG